MTIKLLIYILTILLPFFSTKTLISLNLGNIRKRVDLKRAYWILVGLVLALISISTKTYTDVDIYTNVFEWTNAGKTNYDTIGWCLLCRLFYWLGFNYRGMIPVIIVFSVFLISRACRKIDVDEDKTLALMMVFPGLMHVIQLKFFLAFSIIIYATTFLQRNERNNIPKYLVGILLASMIHSGSIFCLLYLLVILFERINVQKAILYTISGLVIVIVSLKMIPAIAAKFLSEQDLVRYFTGAVEVSSFKWIVEITLSWLFMVCIAWILIRAGRIINKGPNATSLFISRSFTIVCLNGLILPLLIYDQNFHRFIEIEYMIGYELLLFCFKEKMIEKKTNRYIIICILMIALLYCIRYFVIFDRVMPMFLFDGFTQILR